MTGSATCTPRCSSSSPGTASAARAASTRTTATCGSAGSWWGRTAASRSPASTSASSATTGACAASPASSGSFRPAVTTDRHRRARSSALAADLRRARRRVGLPRDRVAQPRRLEHLEREQRALHARRGDVDPEQIEHEVAVEPDEVVDRHPDDLLGGHRRRRLGDRAAVAREAHVRDAAVLAHAELDLELVAAERVVVLELQVRVLELAEVPRLLVVLEDVLAIQVVHQAKTSFTVASPAISRSTSSCVECT